MDIIKSRDNKLVKQCKRLNIKKYRQESGQFLIEGIRFVEEAITSGAEIKYCLYSSSLNSDRAKSILKMMLNRDIEAYMVEDALFEDICDTKTPQGIAAVVKKTDNDTDNLIRNGNFMVVIDRIQDPGNMGTIVRTADAAGVDGVIISEGTVDPYSPKVLRSTMGSIFHIPIIQYAAITEAINELKKAGYSIYASSLHGENKYFDTEYQSKTAVVIGNEANGIDDNVLNMADNLIKIPMPGKAESLNASVACGIIIYEVLKQRMNIDKQH